jgi:hypothetical protein
MKVPRIIYTVVVVCGTACSFSGLLHTAPTVHPLFTLSCMHKLLTELQAILEEHCYPAEGGAVSLVCGPPPFVNLAVVSHSLTCTVNPLTYY